MPDWKSLIRARLASLGIESSAETDVTEEVAQHLHDFYREQLSGGASEEEAYQLTVAELDDMHPLRMQIEESQHRKQHSAVPPGDTRPMNFFDDLWRDLCYAMRSMRKSPLFVLLVVLTLGLGIGANSTVFTVINTLIVNPLPVPKSSELFSVPMAGAQSTSKSSAPSYISYADLKDYERRNNVFASLGGYSSPRVLTWESGGSSERMFCEFVTGAYFTALGIKPAAGRFFLPEEDGTPGAHPVAVINYGTWRTRFGASGEILGKPLRLNNIVFTVVGVAPPQFLGVNAIFGPDFWIPAAMSEQLLPTELPFALSDRGKAAFLGVGRLRPGFKPTQAQANLSTIAADLAREYPNVESGRTVVVQPVRDALFSSASSGTAPVLLGSAVLLAVVGIVLLIACSNVANLLLARSASRQQEIAVRLAMGASRRRLVRQLLTESMLLGLLSGAVGLLVGYAVLRLLWSSLPSSSNFIEPKFDLPVLLLTLAISITTGLVFGTIPALKATRASVAESLKEEARTTGRGRSKVSVANALLVGQVAFSFLLLVTAALFLRSIGRAYEIDPGFQTTHLALFMTNPGQTGYGKAQTKAFYKDVRARISRVPGVVSSSWSTNMPLWSRGVTGLKIEGREQRSESDKITTIVTTVDRGYFETMGVAINRGREFTEVDKEDSAPVAIVNEKLARDYWPAGDPLGKRIQLPDEKLRRQVVGIARTANYTALGEPPQLCVYLPSEQKYSDGMILYVRTNGDPRQVLIAVQRETEAAGPKVVVSGIRTGHEIIDGGLFQARIGVVLLTVFGLLALGLACIGLYGILAYSVGQRRREIGLRMALGAPRTRVLGLILKQGMLLVLIGVSIGLSASLLMGRLLSRLLYGVSATDPISIAAAVLVLLAVASIACYLPARRASRVDPLVALREG